MFFTAYLFYVRYRLTARYWNASISQRNKKEHFRTFENPNILNDNCLRKMCNTNGFYWICQGYHGFKPTSPTRNYTDTTNCNFVSTTVIEEFLSPDTNLIKKYHYPRTNLISIFKDMRSSRQWNRTPDKNNLKVVRHS